MANKKKKNKGQQKPEMNHSSSAGKVEETKKETKALTETKPEESPMEKEKNAEAKPQEKNSEKESEGKKPEEKAEDKKSEEKTEDKESEGKAEEKKTEDKGDGKDKPVEVVSFPVKKEDGEKKDALEQAKEKSEEMEEYVDSLPPEKEKLLKKQGKEAKRAAKKNQKEADRKKAKEAKAAKKAEQEKKDAAKTPAKPAQQGDKNNPKKPPVNTGKTQYAAVMTTGQFLKAFVLMLIPGVNIICVIVWALGGSKNPNKVYFTRAAILFFLIEILVTALLAGGVYIYANEHEAEYLKKANNYTNGLIEYMDIDSYKKLHKLRDIPAFLIDKAEIDKAKKEELKTNRVIENPEEIKSYNDFVDLYVQSMSQKTKDSVIVESTGSQTKQEEKKKLENLEDPLSKKIEENKEKKANAGKDNPETLDEILKKYNVNPKKPGLVYIVITNENDKDCLIAFDPTGTIKKVPTIRVDNQIIYVGGVD